MSSTNSAANTPVAPIFTLADLANPGFMGGKEIIFKDGSFSLQMKQKQQKTTSVAIKALAFVAGGLMAVAKAVVGPSEEEKLAQLKSIAQEISKEVVLASKATNGTLDEKSYQTIVQNLNGLFSLLTKAANGLGKNLAVAKAIKEIEKEKDHALNEVANHQPRSLLGRVTKRLSDKRLNISAYAIVRGIVLNTDAKNLLGAGIRVLRDSTILTVPIDLVSDTLSSLPYGTLLVEGTILAAFLFPKESLAVMGTVANLADWATGGYISSLFKNNNAAKDNSAAQNAPRVVVLNANNA